MDINGRPNHIEDYLITLHSGQWFGFSDWKNKVYENLIITTVQKLNQQNKNVLTD